MKPLYAFALLLALASCKGSEVASVQETPKTEQIPLPSDKKTPGSLSEAAPGKSYVDQQIAESDHLRPVPPAPPVNPTKADLKAYEKRLTAYQKELKAWKEVQVAQAKAYAKANRGPLVQGKGAQYAPNASTAQNSYKPKDSAQAADSSTLQQAGGNAASIPGNGNSTTQTKQDTTEEAAGWQATLAKPVGIVFGVAGIGAILYALYWLWPILFRRKDSTETTA